MSKWAWRRLFQYMMTCVLILGALFPTACRKSEPSGVRGEVAAEEEVVASLLGGSILKEVPEPLSGENPRYPEPRLPYPEAGSSFSGDPFALAIVKVTGPGAAGARHEYSRFDPFNRDKSMVILVGEEGDFFVYRTGTLPYNQSSNLVYTVSGLAEPRWDPDDPWYLWGIAGFRIVRVNVVSGEEEMIRDFARHPAISPLLSREPDLYRVTTKDEGEASADFRYWALMIQGTAQDYRPRYIFCWDRYSDQVLGLYRVRPEESDIDWVGMSVKGNWVIVGGMETNGGNLAGCVIADRGLTAFHRVDYTTSHGDVGLDAHGNEVLVMQNSRTDYIDMIHLDLRTRPVEEADGYEGSGHTRLVRLYYDHESSVGFNSGVHISCNAPGLCLVSTHIGPGIPELNWLDRTNALVRLDTEDPRAYYLSKIYNTTTEYWEETHGSITADGSRVVWASNWNGAGDHGGIFLLQVDLYRPRGASFHPKHGHPRYVKEERDDHDRLIRGRGKISPSS